MTTEEVEQGKILIENMEGLVSVDVDWSFESPHQAGHVLAHALKTIAKGMESVYPDIPREKIVATIIQGIYCQVENFVKGIDEDVQLN